MSDANNLSFGNSVTDIPFTTTQLIRFDLVNSNNRIVFEKLEGATQREYICFLTTSNTIRIQFIDQSTSGNINVTLNSSLTQSQLYHLSISYDGSGSSSGMKIYLDGVPQSVTAGGSGTYVAMQNTTAKLFIGARDGNTFVLNGKQDVLRFWNKELTTVEVLAIATAELAGTDINP